jgi:DNA-binding transcriptional regulator YhcF (GntR family)
VANSGLDHRVRQDKLVRDRAVDALRQAILDGVLEPGRRLTERELTGLTGMSRTFVREALRRLQAEGLVEQSPSRGLRVTLPTAEETEHIYEIRAELEQLAVRLFVGRASQPEVDDPPLAARPRQSRNTPIPWRRFNGVPPPLRRTRPVGMQDQDAATPEG